MHIETDRLLIRPLTADDLPRLIQLRADDEVSRYIGGAAMQAPEAVTRRLQFYLDCHERYGFGMSAINRKVDGEMIGWGGLQPLEETGEIEVGYGFAKEFWGQGYATEAAAACLRYGFEQAGLARIVAVAIPENIGSRRVMEKAGMKFEREALHYGSRCVLYAISRAEFVPRPGLYVAHGRHEAKG
ncbi:MAG TPA: GNAT family N-acetyltransferase [Pyrinomonadaceae bacterium]